MLASPSYRTLALPLMALAALGLRPASSRPRDGIVGTPATQPEAAPPPEGEEYGEFLARPAELAAVPTNDIMKSLRLSSSAKTVGMEVYNRACASCHGADLKGSREQGTPDLTDTQLALCRR